MTESTWWLKAINKILDDATSAPYGKPSTKETKMETPQYILNKDSFTLIADNSVYNVDSTHQKWDKLLSLIKAKDWEGVLDIVQIRDRIAKFTASAGTGVITIKNDTLFYDDVLIDNSLCTRIIEMYYDGFDIQPMINFLANMMLNPSYTAIEGLYRFLEKNKLPITPDGFFLAYKRINANWTDCHTGKIDNRVGQLVSMPRREVEDNPSKDCAPGLHVCSLDYLSHFNGDILIACKINPANVVSVPHDYNGSKMRVCCYEVVQQLSMSLVGGGKEAWESPVVDPTEQVEEEYNDVEERWGTEPG